MANCRLCHQYARRGDLLKYGTRHYAHAECYLDRKPLAELSASQRDKIPYALIKQRGLLGEMDRLRAEDDARVEAYRQRLRAARV